MVDNVYGIRESELKQFIFERCSNNNKPALAKAAAGLMNNEAIDSSDVLKLVKMLNDELRGIKSNSYDWVKPIDFFRFAMHWVLSIDLLNSLQSGENTFPSDSTELKKEEI